MGLYDYVICNYELPGTLPSWYKPGDEFQTKSFDHPFLDKYTITEDGRLLLQTYKYDVDDTSPLGVSGTIQEPVPVEFHGDIEFYHSNWAGIYKGHVYTHHGEDHESVCYIARFTNGRLEWIRQTEYERKPAKPSSHMDKDRAEYEAKKKEEEDGQRDSDTDSDAGRNS